MCVSVEIVLLYVLDLDARSRDQVRLSFRSGDGDVTVSRCCSNQGQALVRRYARRLLLLVGVMMAANLDAERPTKR